MAGSSPPQCIHGDLRQNFQAFTHRGDPITQAIHKVTEWQLLLASAKEFSSRQFTRKLFRRWLGRITAANMAEYYLFDLYMVTWAFVFHFFTYVFCCEVQTRWNFEKLAKVYRNTCDSVFDQKQSRSCENQPGTWSQTSLHTYCAQTRRLESCGTQSVLAMEMHRLTRHC